MAGDARQDRLGAAVAVTPDLDGDGLLDLLIGSPGDNFGGLRGRAAIRSSRDGSILCEWLGDVVNDSFGARVANAGDVDGDGTPDYVILAPTRSQSGFALGALFVYSGANGALLYSLLNASTSSAEVGTDVAALGDVDGDGCSDLVSSNFAFDVAHELVAVISGKTGTTIRTHTGAAAFSGFGIDVDATEDVDLDGIADYIVAAPFDTTLAPNGGAAYVYSGASGALLLSLSDPANSPGYGRFVAGLRDLDGDGRGELLVGNPSYSTPGNDFSGQLLVHSGLDGSVLLTVTGSAGDGLGAALARADDLDGDGIPEIVAAAAASPSFRVFSGASGALLRSFDLDPPTGASLEGRSDLNGDGRADLLVGLPFANAPDQDSFGGRAHVVDLASVTTLLTIDGFSFHSNCGQGLALARDRDGDGHREVAIGCPGGRGSGEGLVELLSGRTGTKLMTLSNSTPKDRFGAALADVRDVDGDGRRDLAVGAPGYLAAGRVEIRSGFDGSLLQAFDAPQGGDSYGSMLASGSDGAGSSFLAIGDPTFSSTKMTVGLVEIHDLLGGAATVSFTGNDPRASFGAAIACVGDVDGDGTLDWAVGAPAENSTDVDAGSVTLYSGASGTAIWKHDGANLREALGSSVAGVPDLDGDGIGEVLAGAPSTTGDRIGRVVAWSGASGAQLFELEGEHKHDRFGGAVAHLGDVNRDGVADFAVGAPGRISDGHVLGAVFLYSGATTALLYRVDGDVNDAGLGQTIVGVGCDRDSRVDPDAIPDLLCGAPDSTLFALRSGRAQLFRLDDLYLQIEPPKPPGGSSAVIETRGGPGGNPVGLFAAEIDGVVLNFFIVLGNFDPLGIWSLSSQVPPSLSGHTLKLRSYAVGFAGAIVDTEDLVVAFP